MGDELQSFDIIDLVYKCKEKHGYYGDEDRQLQTSCQRFKRPQLSYKIRETPDPI